MALTTLLLAPRPAGAWATDEATRPDPPARMLLTGRVLDPAGRPVPKAAVMVIVQAKQPDRPMFIVTIGPATVHQGRCDGSGRFRIEMPRTSSARHDPIVVMALAPGYGVGWVELDPDADAPDAEIALQPEQIIRGRLTDPRGRPARGVAISVLSVARAARPSSPYWVKHPSERQPPWHDQPAWPGPAISDDDGWFTLRGLGRGLLFRIGTDDPRFVIPSTMIWTDADADASAFARWMTIKVEPGPDPKPIAVALEPVRLFTGRVTEADTGRPVPDALVSISSVVHRADAEGRFRAPEPPTGVSRFGPFQVQAQSPGGAPYLIAGKQIEWPEGAVEQTVDLALERGIVVRGKITEEGTGRPVAGAVVWFAPFTIPKDLSVMSVPAATGPDGTYRIVGPPGPGCVVVQGPDEDYILREFGGTGGGPAPLETLGARPGRERFYAHAYRAVELKPGASEPEVNLSLRRGVAVRGRVVGPDGQPVRDGWVFCRACVSSDPFGGWKLWRRQLHDRVRLYDGHFVLHGLDPNAEVPAYVLEPARKLGAVVRFSGKSASTDPVTVRLEPCGTARCRFVRPDGQPVGRFPAGGVISLVIAPGPTRLSRPAAGEGPLFADETTQFRLDPINYPRDFRTDAEGRTTWTALIPGAPYRAVDRSPARGVRAEPRDFTVRPGEVLDLGDIILTDAVRRN